MEAKKTNYFVNALKTIWDGIKQPVVATFLGLIVGAIVILIANISPDTMWEFWKCSRAVQGVRLVLDITPWQALPAQLRSSSAQWQQPLPGERVTLTWR